MNRVFGLRHWVRRGVRPSKLQRPRSVWGAAVAFTVALAASPTAAQAQRAELEKFIRQKVLANGLEVIVAENHGVPIATIEIDVRNGSFTQPPGYEGLAHMYEHMFFKANAQWPRPDEFIQRASELGAVFNGTTQEERVNYYLSLPSDSIEGGLRLIAAALREPKFLKEELDRERQVVLGEYDRNEASPFFELDKRTTELLYPGQWSRKNIIGDRQVLLTVTPEKMREIQRKYYVPNNTALIVTGDVSASRVFELAEAALGDWKGGADPFVADPIPPIPPMTQSTGVFVEQDVGAITVFIRWQGPSVRADPEATFSADVFSDALNQPGSTLQRRLVDSGLWQSVGVNYYTLNQAGPITISGQTSPERLKEALAALHREIDQFADPGYITQEQLDATKAERAVSTAFGFDRPSEFAHTVGFWWSVANLEYYMGYIDSMAKRSQEDMRAYARKYILGKPYVVGVLLP
ncbi:MAG: pitrilysin family protein, partial [Gemmatimonadaceae bacterium]